MSELSPESRALLDLARADAPSAADRARVQARVFAAASAGPGARAPGASTAPAVRATSTVFGMAVGSKALLGLVAATSFLAGALVTAAIPRPTRVVVERRVEVRTVPGPVVTVTVPAPAPSIAAPVTPSTTSVVIAARAPTPRRAVVETPGALDRELDALRTIDRLLAEGDLDGGLAAIAEYRATFRGGQLRADVGEREVVALCRLGRDGEARARARAFGGGSAAARAVANGCASARP